MKHLDFHAVLLGFAAGYAVPVLMACFMTVASWLLWFWIIAPAAAGFVAAKVSGRLPLLHGLAASLFGLGIFTLLSAQKSLAAWLVWFAVNVACGIFGAWLCRRHERRTA